MSEQEQNGNTAARVYAECWNNGDMAAIDEIFAADLKHAPFMPGWPMGREGFRKLVGYWRNAFPDIHEELVDSVAEGDKVATRFRLTGTHKGDFSGVPGTGRKISIEGAEIFRFENGKIVEYFYVEDALGVFLQLGAVELPEAEIAGVASAAS
ncbi:MAG: ester cyclase [Methyloceanibacter sp.]|nr:ester cyclase [Methyloceanibacter sp.]